MLYTECAFNPVMNESLRISVMSRHTQNDGITPDPRLSNWDMHIPKLGPSAKLIGDYYKRGLSWSEFAEKYIKEIRGEAKVKLVHFLAKLALEQDVTIICVEESHTHCHRSLLANECKRLYPNIVIIHK